MQHAQLYINNTSLDLPNDSLIALSYAINTLADLSTVQGNISNTISLPNTAVNRQALGYPDDINFNGAGIIRKKLNCRYVQNGVDVIAQGNLRITGASKTSIKVVISCGNTDFFDLLTGKLTDLDLHEYDHLWNRDNVINSWPHREGYIYPIINYGNLFNDDSKWGTAISVKDMRPAMFAHTLVQKIVNTAGYTLVNKITDDIVTAPIYQNMLLPFSSDKLIHPQRYMDQYSVQDIEVLTVGNPETSTRNGNIIDIHFDKEVHDAGNNFNGLYWTAPAIMTVNINVNFSKIHLHRTGGLNDASGAYFKIYIIPANGSRRILNQVTLGFNELYNDHLPVGDRDDHPDHHGDHMDVNLTFNNLAVSPGDKIYIAYETSASNGDITVQVYNGTTLTIKLNGDNVLYGEQLQLEGSLPDMSQSDFLKFIAFMFCAVLQTDNITKTVTIVPFGYITQNMPLAIDWSAKVTNADEDYDVQIGDYCQQNEAKWQHDDTVAPDTYGNGVFKIDDQNLDLYQDIYDLPFAASFETQVLGNLRTLFISKIPDIKGGSFEMETQTEHRVCLLNPTNGSINYREDDTPLLNYTGTLPLTYFSSGNPAVPDLTLTSIFANHYKQLVAILSDQRKLTCYLNLTEMDIQNLDFFIPIYIQKYAAYFYISKITDFTSVKPCKVDLISLP
jgi:hypothetical protein